MYERNYPTIFLVGILICVAVFAFMSIKNSYKEKNIYEKDLIYKIEQRNNTFSQMPLEAGSAYLYDMTNKEILFEKDAGNPKGIASITKLMTFTIAWPKIKDLEYITISEKSVETEGSSPLDVGSKWSPEDLLSLMLVSSSNDATEAIAEAAEKYYGSEEQVIREMNLQAQKIGMQKTFFKNVTGLDQENKVSNISTAYDITLLAESIIKEFPEILEGVARPKFTLPDKSYTLQNTNAVISDIPHIILSKTGYTDYAGGNLVIAYISPTNDHIVISTVLGSSFEGRFRDTLTLVRHAETYFDQIKNGR